MMAKIPNIFFLVSGSAEGKTELNSFDNALLNAGVGNTNLIKLSSILPPGIIEVEKQTLPYGAFIPIAYGDITSAQKGDIISAAIAVGIPENENLPGLIMEHSANIEKQLVEKKVIEMVEYGFEMRNFKLKEIRTVSIEHKVDNIATAFAGAVLWYK